MEFPVIIKLAPRFVEHLIGCEYGSFEDCHKFVDGKYVYDQPRVAGSPHIVTILERRKSGVEIRDKAEATELYYAMASGTFQLAYTSGQGFKGALQEAQRVCRELRSAVTDPNVLRFRPDGY